MPNQYTKEQLWKLYEKLPEELQEAVFGVETADNIWSVCENNNIDAVSEVAKLVGNVLLGILPPDDFQAALEKELKLKKDVAKKVSQEINRFVFYPVRTDLEKLYQTKIAPTGEVVPTAPTAPTAPSPTAPIEQVKPEAPKGEDTYREPLE